MMALGLRVLSMVAAMSAVLMAPALAQETTGSVSGLPIPDSSA